MFTLIALIIVLWFAYWLYKKLTKSENESETKPEKQTFSDELKKETQEEFYKIEKHYRSFKEGPGKYLIDTECLKHMILAGELKFSSGKTATLDSLDNYIRFREITEICLREGYNPRKKEDREMAEAFLDLEEDDEDDLGDDSSYDDWDDYTEQSSGSSRSFEREEKEYGSYVIQYRDAVGGSWVDGPGSNNESIAESMFDRFIRNDPRGDRRCRLVYKVNGRVKSVLSTN